MPISAAGEEVSDGRVCTVKAKSLLVAVFCINLLTCLGAAFGDGGVFIRRKSYTNADVLQPTQKVYIRWDGSQEKLLIQTKYEGPAEEMVWIVPVPSQPTVEKADGSIFQDLSKETADLAIDYTDFVDLNISTFGTTMSGPSNSGTTAFEWYERIGDYEVALLRPVGSEDVIQWLNTNGFATPEVIQPILEDYIREGWWMVAAKIAPEALTPITRDKLAQGTLHPLAMTFQSSVCAYPMRLTRMAAGPVEELIYIEGPHHCEPATLADGGWEISLFGRPIREVPQNYFLSDIERAVEVKEGRTKTEFKRPLTRLRRVFQPSEMMQDVVFREVDYTKWFASDVPARMAQAATQYGRCRDPNGIGPLVSVLSSDALDHVKPAQWDYQPWPSPSAKILSWDAVQRWSAPTGELTTVRGTKVWNVGCEHLRSSIWALGEIGIEHETGPAVEETLLRCARHDNQLVRMEAYIALTKLGCERLGPVLAQRVTDILQSGPPANRHSFNPQTMAAEMDIVVDWIVRYGDAQQKSVLAESLAGLIVKIPLDTRYDLNAYPQLTPALHLSWDDWIVWLAACTQDAHLIPALQSRHPQCADGQADCMPASLLRAEAACGSPGPTATLLRQLRDEEDWIRQQGVGGIDSSTALGAAYWYYPGGSLRVRIIHERGLRYGFYPMPSDASDNIVRSALNGAADDEWYALYLLPRIKRPQIQEKETLRQIWDRHDESTRLVVVDVLYVWGDEQMLLGLYGKAEFPAVKSEIAWALARLNVPEAASVVEEQTRASWNALWLSLGWPFPHDMNLYPSVYRMPAHTDAMRMEQACWDYFRPQSAVLDPERLAALQRLAADGTIHAGMRFDLLGVDYGGTDWGLPLLEKAARDILAVDSSPGTVQKITSTMKSVGNSGFMVAPR
jgi:hypothetical protein